ncbi:tellurite resistance TerB family protein [Paracoccus aminophilus]|uniref:Co-chaperone DjlA N-terminal domain-containing protein n=1 Tax=Paracoccus aminophilus JCM 7686 TaxID=1367847 RepID=S5XVV6_PARAH|nr:TerB family tellurite resistance protein [Paracoccus aminophilus]AGT09417.1 hypothetical protein JCM7686_2347 [Paracoccus aminophilus JCM 7686]
MFRNLFSRLFHDDFASSRLTSQDAEVAIAALLVRLARSDDNYSAVEKNRIDQILARRRGIDMTEAAERRMAAEMVEAEAPDTVRFTRAIKDRIALEDRIGIISALWEIAYADGVRTAAEESFLRLVAGLLGVTDVDSGLARQRVLQSLGRASD